MSEPKVEIEIKTRGDASGAVAVEKAVEKATTATSKGAEQSAKAAEQMSEAEEKMAALMEQMREQREALQEQAREAADEESAKTEEAIGGLNRKALALGALGGVMTAGVAVLTRWFQAQEHLTQALDNATTAGGAFIDEVLTEWIGKGAAVKQVLDDITRALGGQTEEMKALNEPLNQYADQMGAAEQAAKKFTDELKEQAEALAGVKNALAENLELLREQSRTQETAAEIAARIEKEGIEEGGGTPEEKAQRIAEVDKRLLKEKAAIRQRERTAEIEAANTEIKARENELAKAEQTRKKQEDRVNAARKVESTGRILADLNEEHLRGRRAPDDPAFGEAAQRHEAAKAAAQGVGTVAEESSRLTPLDEQIARQRAELDDARKAAAHRARILGEQQHRDDLQTGEAVDGHSRKQASAARSAQRKVDAQVDAESKAQAQAAGDAAITEAAQGLKDKAREMSTGPTKAILGMLHQALTDGEGNTQAELAVVQQMLAQMGGGKQQNAQAMQQALQAMGQLQAENSNLSRQMAAAFQAVTATLKSMETTLGSVVAEQAQIKSRLTTYQ